jgi:hypothetical protein
MMMRGRVVDMAVIRQHDGRRGQGSGASQRGGEEDFQHGFETFSASRLNAAFPIIFCYPGAKEFPASRRQRRWLPSLPSTKDIWRKPAQNGKRTRKANQET